jgi:hypothetical protein
MPRHPLRGAGGVAHGAAGAAADPTDGGAIFLREDLFSTACVTIFRRPVAGRGLRRARRPGKSDREFPAQTCSAVHELETVI